MQWIAIMVVIFLIFGLRRSHSRGSIVAMVLAIAATLALWYSQMTTTTS